MIIAGFLGVGKTSLAERYPEAFMDIDSSVHAYLKDGSKNPSFITDYYEDIIKNHEHKHITSSTHLQLIELFKKNNIEHVIVLPDIELKDVYISRYKNRENTDDFIQKIYNNWEKWITRLSQEPNVIFLKEGENLVDKIVFDKSADPRDINLNKLMKQARNTNG